MSDAPGASSSTPQTGAAAFPTAASAAAEPANGAQAQVAPSAQPAPAPAPAAPAPAQTAPAAPAPAPAPAKPATTFAVAAAPPSLDPFDHDSIQVPAVGIVKEFSDWLRFLVDQKGSDLHVKVGSSP